jgi:SAM-dependent methyltransferase
VNKKKKISQILFKDKAYTKHNGAYCFLDKGFQKGAAPGKAVFFGLEWIQNSIKRYGRFYYLLLKIFGPVATSRQFIKCCKKYLEKYDENAVILNIGSGPQFFEDRSDIINIDIFPFLEVDIVANACDLPIENDTVDCIFNMAMLEHVPDPEVIVHEMKRIIKPGGTVIAAVPFMQPFHAAPGDYYRWTAPGLETLFSAFTGVTVKIAAGPTSGMLWVLEEWLALLFSCGSKRLHDLWFVVFMIGFFPLKYLDCFMVHLPFASNCSSSFYIVAGKPLISRQDSEVRFHKGTNGDQAQRPSWQKT